MHKHNFPLWFHSLHLRFRSLFRARKKEKIIKITRGQCLTIILSLSPKFKQSFLWLRVLFELSETLVTAIQIWKWHKKQTICVWPTYWSYALQTDFCRLCQHLQTCDHHGSNFHHAGNVDLIWSCATVSLRFFSCGWIFATCWANFGCSIMVGQWGSLKVQQQGRSRCAFHVKYWILVDHNSYYCCYFDPGVSD